MTDLKELIKQKKAIIGVVGVGYVGLPLAVAFAKKGYVVKAYDVDKSKLTKLVKGQSYIGDVSSEELIKLVRQKLLQPINDVNHFLADIYLICVPTPLKKDKPDISFVKSAARLVGERLQKGNLVILESTIYPGGTTDLLAPILESKSHLKAGKDFYLTCVPERVDPGNQKFPITKVPVVIGGVNKDSTDLAALLFKAIINRVYRVSSPSAAEMTKLLENSFRLVNISFINELAMMTAKMGLNINEVIKAAKTKPYGFMPFYPGPGIGGHCIPVDPVYLNWQAKRKAVMSAFIALAVKMNKTRVRYVAKQIMAKKPKRVLLLGIAYKKDVADIRHSPGLEIMKILIKNGYQVNYSDPLVNKIMIGDRKYLSQKLTGSLLKKADLTVLLVAHSQFPFDLLKRHRQLIYDTVGALSL